ncbi:MAG: MlaD family protein [Rhodoferax sp.]|nr:MlaD family protein [Rhodoferax sp.]MDP3654906.1 MlaD family protein [Rhodoferax sp.]
MENKSHALAAGIFVLGVAAMLVAMAVWLTRDNSDKRVFEISSREGVTGLQAQAGVRYKGVPVGRVSAIELDRKTVGNVLVRITVNDSAPITQSTFASLGFQGVTGLAFIQLDDAGESTQPLATGPEQLGRIPMRAGLMSRLTEQGSSLVSQLEQASQRVNGLLAPDNQKNLMNAIANLGQAAASISRLSQRAEQVLGAQAGPGQPSLPQLMQDANASLKTMQATAERLGASADSVKTSANEFKRMSARMNEPGGTLDKIAEGSHALVTTGQSLNSTLVPRLNRTFDDTARAVRQVGRVADSVTDNPQSLLLGRGQLRPGPGESGFVAPAAR